MSDFNDSHFFVNQINLTIIVMCFAVNKMKDKYILKIPSIFLLKLSVYYYPTNLSISLTDLGHVLVKKKISIFSLLAKQLPNFLAINY